MNRALTITCVSAILFGVCVKLVPVISYHAGQKSFAKQEYTKAYKNFKKAYKFNPKNKDYKYYYVKSLTKLPPDTKIQKEVFDIASSNAKDSAQQLASEQVSNWRRNIITNIGDNYIEQAPFSGEILRWDINSFPLKVSITNKSNIDVPPYYKEEIQRALAQWQTSIDFLKFTLVSKDANIAIEILPTPSNICSENECKYVVGFTTPDYRGSHLKKMTIVLYAKDPRGNYFSDKELFNTILHEIGHSLGIMGHSYSSDDLMYMNNEGNQTFYAPYRSSFQYLSSKDINTIRLLYKLTPQICNTPLEKLNTKGLIYAPVVLGTSEQISLRKLKEAQNYIKKAPELAGGYIDLAIANMELNNKKDAIKAMQKAVEYSKTDTEKYTAYYNLSLIYFESKKYDKALEWAEKAKQISNNDDVKELIMNINLKNSKKYFYMF